MAQRICRFRQMIPRADSSRLKLLRIGDETSLPHVSLAGDTYTITISRENTAGRFSVIDMHIPPNGGPVRTGTTFEEIFIVLEGEVGITIRRDRRVVRAGDTVHIPANAPHQFHNGSGAPARLLCI